MEIGSEFFIQSNLLGNNTYLNLIDGEKRYILSGRTALAHIADDILRKHGVFRIALPAYCCGSMVAPFHKKKIEILFYQNNLKSFSAVIDKVDVALVMDYFGFSNANTLEIAKICKATDKILIVDATQTAFSKLETYKYADYIISSHRKWTDSLSATAYCKDGFSIKMPDKINSQYLSLWREASTLKYKYLTGELSDKEPFLGLYKQANQLLENDYEDYNTSNYEIERFESVSSELMRQKRRTNAEFLLNELSKNDFSDKVHPIFHSLKVEDCPLFLPVNIEKDIRFGVRNEMISKGIYCPIHWPIDLTKPNCKTDYHDTELSLICDQRYDVNDMKRQIDALKSAIFD